MGNTCTLFPVDRIGRVENDAFFVAFIFNLIVLRYVHHVTAVEFVTDIVNHQPESPLEAIDEFVTGQIRVPKFYSGS